MFPFYNKDRGLIPSIINPNKSLIPSIAPKPAPAAPKPVPVVAPVTPPTTQPVTQPTTDRFLGGPSITPTRVPTAAELKAAEDAAKVGKFQGEINPLLDTYNNMFGGLYGRMDTAFGDQSNTTRKTYAGQRQTLTDNYNQEVPNIDLSYYLSGVGDSSLRLGGLGKAETGFKQSLGKVSENEQADLAQIGSAYRTKRAGYEADQAGIADVRKRVAESTNPDELQSVLNDVQTRIRSLQADTAGFDTAEGFRGNLARVAPVKDLTPIADNLKSLMNGAAHPALKREIANQILGSSGLSEEQQKDLFSKYVEKA